MTPTLELNEGNISNFAKFEYEGGSSKLKESLKNKQNFLYPYYRVRQPSELEAKFMSKFYHLGGKGRTNHPPKGPQTGSAKGGGR